MQPVRIVTYGMSIIFFAVVALCYCSFLVPKHTVLHTLTPQVHGNAARPESPACVEDVSEVRIYTYMFHYIIPDKFIDPKNRIEYGNSISPDTLEAILRTLYKATEGGKIRIVSLKDLEQFKKTKCFPNKNIVLLTVDDGWDDGYNFLFPLAKKYSTKFNLAIIADKVSTVSSEINNFLNEKEIQEMLDSHLFTIASHSYSHIELRNMTGALLEKELKTSKELLQGFFREPINTIVFPSGKHDEVSIRAAKEYGYTFGFTTKGGMATVHDLETAPLTLPRIRVSRTSNIEKIFLFR